MHGRELLIKDLVNRVGNGSSIRVWADYWLDDDGMRAPWIKNNLIDINLKVSALIDFERRDWNGSVLEELFFPEDIIKIKATKPAQPSINTLKEQVWKLQTEPKIKVFLWKMLSSALPVGDLLSHRKMKVDGRCQMCGQDEESIFHILFACSLSRQVWALSAYPAPCGGFENTSVFAHIHHFLINRDNLSWPKEIRKSFPWILWRLWKNRNSFVFESKSFSPFETAQKIKDDVNGWFAAQSLDSGLVQEAGIEAGLLAEVSPSVIGEVWSPPPSGWVKCNVGVSWSRRNSVAGAAWVLRDEVGMVLIHSRRAFSHILSLQDASLFSLVWAVESMVSHKLCKVVFAFEDSVLVGAVNRPKAWPSFRFHSMEVLSVLKLVSDWSLVSEKSSANRGAALIAKSVTVDCRLRSYVATGFPFWLSGLFCSERVLSSR